MINRIRGQRRDSDSVGEKFMICPNCNRRGSYGRCRWCGFDATDPEAIAQLRAQQARKRAMRHAAWQRVYNIANGLFHVNVRDFYAFLATLLKWTLLGGAVGILAGTASAIFLITLAWATNIRLENATLIFLLPVGGFIVGWLYYRFAGVSAQGNNLVIEEVNANKAQIPFRMAPLVLFGTVMTHLFGGSAGREGTAIQMGASLADTLRRALRLSPEDRRLMIMAGISGGFGSVFGTPVAGFVFGMEVQSVGRIRYEGIIPCLVAAYVGDIVTRLWGAAHSHYPHLVNLEIDPLLLLKVVIAGVAFGLTSILFVELTHGIKHLQASFVRYPPLRSFIGGLVIVGLALALGTNDYLGLSLPLIQQSVSGEGVATFAFLLKLVFTAITLGSGFLGGEVTPLFVIGSTLGYSLGVLLGVDPAFLASIGFVVVFAGASNTPLACSLMGIELFGGGSPLYLILGCVIAYLASGHRGIYVTQLVGSPKFTGADILNDESLRALAERRGGGWLPALPGVPGQLARRYVRSIMSSRPVSVKPDTPLRDLIDIVVREGVRSLPVLNAQNVVIGIVTDNDLKRAGLDANLTLLMRLNPRERESILKDIPQVTARDVMSHPAVTISQVATLAQSIDVLEGNQLKRLPVVDEAGHLMGMITRSDLLREIVSSAQTDQREALFNWDTRVEDVELEPVVTTAATTPLYELIPIMRDQKRLIVVDKAGKAVGILTENDVFRRIQNGERAAALDLMLGRSDAADTRLTQTAADLMTAPLITISDQSSAFAALKLLIENGIKRLPVIDADQHPIGMVGRAGLTHMLMTRNDRADSSTR